MVVSSGMSGSQNPEQHASPEELAAYVLDPSQIDTTVREHISVCTICAPEVAWMREQVHELDQYPRCPSVDALVRFALGESSAEEQLVMAKHLRTCQACTEEVEWTRVTFQPALQPTFPALRRIAASLVSPPSLSLGVRGVIEPGSEESTRSSRLYKAENLEITLNIEADEGESYLISGEILHTQPIAATPDIQPMALLYTLPEHQSQAEPALAAEATVTPGNDFDLHAVPAGSYRLDVIYGDQVTALQPVAVP
jgi:hypothetical protein